MKMKIEHQVFNFWKDNKIAGHFQLTEKELIEKFKTYLPTKGKEWAEYYGTRDCLSAFISQELNAVGNHENKFAEYDIMEEVLKPIRTEYLEKV